MYLHLTLSKQLSGGTANTTIADIFTELSSQYFGLSCKPRDVTFLGVYFFWGALLLLWISLSRKYPSLQQMLFKFSIAFY